MLLQLGFDLVTDVSKKIVEESKKKPLGVEIGSTGASGDKTKSGDDIVEKAIISSLDLLSQKEPEKRIILVSEETGLVEFGRLFLILGKSPVVSMTLLYPSDEGGSFMT